MRDILLADGQDAATFTGAGPVHIGDHAGYWIQVVADDAGALGSLTVQHSADGVTWVDHGSVIQVSGTDAAGETFTEYARYMKVEYVDTGALGTLTIKMNIQETSDRH